MRILRLVSFLFVLAPAAAFAQAQRVSAANITKLEQARDKKPNDVKALRALGIAYYKNDRFADARTVLERARTVDPRDGVVALYIGLSAERVNDFAGAKMAYETYLATGKSGGAKSDVEKRLAAIERQALQQESRLAVQREQQLATQRVANTVAVLPFEYTGDSNYSALSRGMADLIITDLGLVPSIRLLERDRVQAMFSEIALSQTGAVDRATQLRSGRLLQAERLVTGRIAYSPATVTYNAQATNVATTQPQGQIATVSGPLNQLFQQERQLVEGLMRNMGINITPQLLAQLNRRPTQNLQAFLAYSRGLVASDAGRLEEAANFFDNARTLDPGFSAAALKATEARAAVQGQTVTAGTIESNLRGNESAVVASAERGSTAATNDALGSTLGNVLADVNPSGADAIGRPAQTTASTRDAVASTTAAETTARTGTVTLIIRRP
jgi:tetratricopeptide (TPR) repeat protein